MFLKTTSLFLFGVCLLLSGLPSAKAQTALRIGEGVVGGITKKTPFDATTIRGLFPQMKVTYLQSESAESVSTLRIRDKSDEVIVVYPKSGGKKIHSVVVLSNAFKNTLGPRIGDTFEAAFGKQKYQCAAGTESMSGYVICSAPKSTTIKYVFSGTWNGPDGKLPPANILKKWTIEQITVLFK